MADEGKKEPVVKLKPKIEDKTRRIEKKLWKHGGGSACPIPVDWLREIGWGPREEVLITFDPKKGFLIEKFERNS